MGKSKKKDSASKAAPKCSCDHPYQCNCGNRPPRPSKGHKWDPETQAWGGKGHKQKGASGQVASSAEKAKTTALGNTKVEMWQRLPSALLGEWCRRQKRPPPKFKDLKGGSTHLYRAIVKDSKNDADKDLFFVPSKAVANEEQAKEEAALLALLTLTPDLPHERKLPEPYKTTWLNAIQAAKEENNKESSQKQNSSKTKKGPPAESKQTSSKGGGGAKASSSLTLSNRHHVSTAERRKEAEEKRRKRNAKIRHHEAVRMANRDHPVFLSAMLRKKIQQLLRGDNVDLDEETVDEVEDCDMEEVQAYVERRLHDEGFTARQARMAYQKLPTPPGNIAEEEWGGVYDQCLQWLCIHLDEDQLPERFDPREGTLDVVVPAKQKSKSANTENAEHVKIANEYGITTKEAQIVAARMVEKDMPLKQELWKAFVEASGSGWSQEAVSPERQVNQQTAEEEMETLQAIFSDNFKKISRDGLTTVTLALAGKFQLEFVTNEGLYPSVRPESVLVTGDWPGRYGSFLHIEIIKFIADLELDEPMIYEIYTHTQSLIETVVGGKGPSVPLFPMIGEGGSAPTLSSKKEKAALSRKEGTQDSQQSSEFRSKQLRRPKDRSPFWSKLPSQCPPASPFPKIGILMEKARKELPAAKARGEFLAAMTRAEKSSRVVLVTGETGCGKTTQIPQFILEESPSDAKIVVAQPRRLAAVGVAGRVADERGEKQPGIDSVGYAVRGDTAVCARTRLLFCTTGVILRQLQSAGALECVTHVIVDEVHERQLDTDILLGVLKQSLKIYKHLRVVLMSATIDAKRFAGYWGSNTPTLHIPGRTYPVTNFMLEDVLSLTGYIPSKKGKKPRRYYQNANAKKKLSPWADSERSDEEEDEEEEDAIDNPRTDTTEQRTSNEAASNADTVNRNWTELAERVTDVDFDLLGILVKKLVQRRGASDGSILIFLSGVPEINKGIEAIRRITRGLPIDLLPLHGGLQPKEQSLVFRPAEKGLTKVIVSTNVAETSITIPDCTVVIDSCREKQSSYNPTNRMPVLLEKFASQASLKQRKGRAGRVREGTCYKLISNSVYAKLQAHGDPEIKRCALDQTLLSLLFMGLENGSGNFLSTLLDPPSRESTDAAIASLRSLGAISSDSVSLTPLGMHLAGIPAPPTVGKILVMGSILGCRSAALAMAAGMTIGRSPFLRINTFRKDGVDPDSPEEVRKQSVVEARSVLFQNVGNSDHAMLAACYINWNGIKGGGGQRKLYCESLGLSFNGMREMKQLVSQFDASLSTAGYVPSRESDRNLTSWRVIRTCAVSALSPSNLVRVRRPKTKYAQTAEGAQEMEGVAKELSFFIRPPDASDQNKTAKVVEEERVFMHPSSANFTVGSFSCPWLVYHELVRTSKPFLRDATECSAYALLLFGGELQVEADKDVIFVDNWARLSAKARIAALIGGLRGELDSLLAKKIEEPSLDIASSDVMRVITELLVTDGLAS